MLKLMVVLCALLAVVAADQAMGFVGPVPDRFKGQEGCYIEELDRVVPFGQNAYSRCVEYSCSRDVYTITGCGKVFASPPCEVVSDNTKPYPECCPKIKCPSGK